MGHVIMMLGCKSNVDKLETTDLDVYERLEVEFKKNAEIIPGYTFDSIVNTDSLLKFYVTDSLDHFNNVLASQKITYSIRTLLKTTINLPSTSELYVNMPNRQDPKVIMDINTMDLLKGMEPFKNHCFEKAIENMYYLQTQNPSINYLDNLNTEIAWLLYHEDVAKEAFFGVDSYAIINGYLLENEYQNSKYFHNLIDSVKISSYVKIDDMKFLDHVINILDSCSKN